MIWPSNSRSCPSLRVEPISFPTPESLRQRLGSARPTRILYEAEVTLDVFRADPATIDETPLGELPLDIMPFLLPSRFVPSDRLSAFARREFGDLPKGHGRVTAICNWLYDNIDYQRGSSDEQTTADESLILRAGVCRDFAHLGIAFCRALNIPARFVSCYAYGLEPRDFHAVFEAYLGGRWWLFDGTRQANLDGFVRIGVGRDAAEIAFASPFGEMEAGPVKITIDHADGSPEFRVARRMRSRPKNQPRMPGQTKSTRRSSPPREPPHIAR